MTTKTTMMRIKTQKKRPRENTTTEDFDDERVRGVLEDMARSREEFIIERDDDDDENKSR